MKKLIVDGFDLTKLMGVLYVGSRHPGNTSVEEFFRTLHAGGNCEILALCALWIAGFYVEPKRSIELWHDKDFTVEVVAPYKAFDVFLFLPKGVDPHKLSEVVKGSHQKGEDSLELDELKRFHQGIYIGQIETFNSLVKDCILHLPKPTSSVIWPLEEFAKCEKEYWLFKVKRPVIRRI